MPTTNLGLPTITGNLTADVVRDMNALAEEVDFKVASKQTLATHLAEKASATAFGHIKIGTGLKVADGIASVDLSDSTIGTSKTKASTEFALGIHAKSENHMLTNGGFLSGDFNLNDPAKSNKIFQIGSIGAGAIGAPPESYGILISSEPLDTGYIKNEFTSVSTGNKFYRSYAGGAWTPWIKILTANDAAMSKTIAGSYAGSGVNGRKIELGVTPKMVVLFRYIGTAISSVHLIIETFSFKIGGGEFPSTNNNTYVTTGGFIVDGSFSNTSGNDFRYVALI